ncbi:hypothetical protein SLA2020_448240, partial [Shorea laevis]
MAASSSLHGKTITRYVCMASGSLATLFVFRVLPHTTCSSYESSLSFLLSVLLAVLSLVSHARPLFLLLSRVPLAPFLPPPLMIPLFCPVSF